MRCLCLADEKCERARGERPSQQRRLRAVGLKYERGVCARRALFRYLIDDIRQRSTRRVRKVGLRGGEGGRKGDSSNNRWFRLAAAQEEVAGGGEMALLLGSFLSAVCSLRRRTRALCVQTRTEIEYIHARLIDVFIWSHGGSHAGRQVTCMAWGT